MHRISVCKMSYQSSISGLFRTVRKFAKNCMELKKNERLYIKCAKKIISSVGCVLDVHEALGSCQLNFDGEKGLNSKHVHTHHPLITI